MELSISPGKVRKSSRPPWQPTVEVLHRRGEASSVKRAVSLCLCRFQGGSTELAGWWLSWTAGLDTLVWTGSKVEWRQGAGEAGGGRVGCARGARADEPRRTSGVDAVDDGW